MRGKPRILSLSLTILIDLMNMSYHVRSSMTASRELLVRVLNNFKQMFPIMSSTNFA